VTSPLPPAAEPGEIVPSTQKRLPPTWYTSINVHQKAAPGSRALENRLKRIRDFIKECKSSPRTVTAAQFNRVRTELHELEFLYVNAIALRKSRLLHNDDGLPQIFDFDYTGGVTYPWDIKSDAEELYNKWYQEMFDPYLLRGLKITGGKGAGKHKTMSLDEGYPGRISCNYWGAGYLVNGQWWPSQLCGLRDGAHGSAQGGIHGKKAEGAYSIVLSGNHYQDRDEGDEIWYSGTDGDNGVITESTQRMIESTGSGKPVRVLRSQALPATNRYKPERGYRYDGLYDVLDHRVVEPIKQIHLFHLKRREGQDPIRCVGVEARPTAQETRHYEDVREKLGFT